MVVGRGAEIELLERAVAGAGGGGGGLLAVLGEAGVGKSRLAAAAEDAARARGMAVLRGRAVSSPAPVPYRPVTEALLSGLRRESWPAIPDLGGLTPALHVLVPPWAPAGDGPPAEPSVILVGEAALALTRRLAGDGGALLVLDDLHWADAGTLELVDYLADKLAGTGVVAVATCRTGERTDAERLLRALGAGGLASVAQIRRLPAPDVAAMVSATLGTTDVPPEVVSAVEQASEGLPFLVEELLASLIDQGSLVESGGTWLVRGRLAPAVPSSFASLVADRLARLPRPAASTVRTAAVLGERFSWNLLARTSSSSPADLLDALRLAAELQLVEGDQGDRDFRFCHALTRTAVLETLLPPERAELAHAALRALEAEGGTTTPDQAALAVALAELAGDRERAGELLIGAAEAALHSGAVSVAVAAAESVVASGRGELRLRGHELILDASVVAGDVRRVVEMGERLLARLEAGRAPAERRARAHLQLAAAAVTATDWRRAEDHLAQVAVLVPDAGKSLRARSELLHGRVSLGRHQVDDALARAAAAHRLATELSDPDLLCEALELLGRAERVRDLPASEHHFTRALLTAEANGLSLHEVRALHELGTLELMRLVPPARLREARDRALVVGAPALAAQAAMHLAVAHFVRHELEPARAAALQAIEEAERFRLGLLVPAATTVLGAIEAVEGDREAAVAAFERARPAMDAEIEATGRAHVLALGALAHEDRAGALAQFAAAERVCPPGSGVARSPWHGLYTLLLALDPDVPTTLADELVADAHSLHVATLALVDLARAVHAGRTGDAAEAAALFSSGDTVLAAASWYRNVGRRLVAEAAIADGWGTPAVWLRDALAFFVSAGLDEPARACRSLLRRAGAAVPRGGRGGGVGDGLARLGVTRREADVLALVAGGLSNKEIAARLYLSTRTVEKHVERLLLKCRCPNRVRLAAFASAGTNTYVAGTGQDT